MRTTDLTSKEREKKKMTMDIQKTVQLLDPAFGGILNSVRSELAPPPPGGGAEWGNSTTLKKKRERDGMVRHRCAYIHFSNQFFSLRSHTQLHVPMKA